MRIVQTGPLHPQLGGGGGPHPPRPVQLRHGGGRGVGEVLVLGYCGQVLQWGGHVNTLYSKHLNIKTEQQKNVTIGQVY